jgi:hypothetical protein
MMLERPAAWDVPERDYEELLKSLAAKKIRIPTRAYGVHDVRPTISSTSRLPSRLSRLLPRARRRSKYCLLFSFSVECPREVPAFDTDGLSDDDLIGIERTVAAHELAQALYLIVLAMNIAYPGAGGLLGGAIVEGDRLETSMANLDASEFTSYTAQGRPAWPPIHALPFQQVWSWLVRLPGLANTESPSPAGRAVNALSHLLVEPYSRAVILMWAMVGIEAIYTAGSGGLVQQVRERTRVFLGVSDRSDKLVSTMYDLRSRFVHGDLNFAGAHGMGVTAAYAARDELAKATDLATSILLASVQELIRRDWLGVKFSTLCTSA